jgi:hypothetical protein
MASKSTTAAKYIYDTLVMVSLGAWKMTIQFILAVRLIPILTHLSSRWTVPLSVKKFKKISNPPLGSYLANEPNFWLIK